MVNVLSLEMEVRVPAKIFWDAIIDVPNFVPKALPPIVKSVAVTEGDGHSVGSVRSVNYDDGTKGASFVKEKLETVDHENMLVTGTVMEGDILRYYKTVKPTLRVLYGDDATSCLVKWSVEYETSSSEVLPPHAFKETAYKNIKAVEEYLLATA